MLHHFYSDDIKDDKSLDEKTVDEIIKEMTNTNGFIPIEKRSDLANILAEKCKILESEVTRLQAICGETKGQRWKIRGRMLSSSFSDKRYLDFFEIIDGPTDLEVGDIWVTECLEPKATP